MKLFFLDAQIPIVKRYELDSQGNLVKHPYPFIYEVTSHEEHCADISGFFKHLSRFASSGNCLVKGVLSRPLVSESRAGSTDRDTKTNWICLDLDGIENYQSVDLFLDSIGCGDIDYVLQWSSSMGLENKGGFRCHVFMLLDREVHPQLLKNWLTQVNLGTPLLADQLQLTATGNSLRWPLDVTTCQNDKLLYIAPPALGPGITDPYPSNKRIELCTRSKRHLVFNKTIDSREALREKIDAAVARLREAKGLPKKRKGSTKYKISNGVEYMMNPDTAVITDVKTERGFVYFNLNGGDSWAYYHPEDNPTFIYNFKGEPAYRTEDLLPEYWDRIKQARISQQMQPTGQGLIYLAFRDFRSGNYYNGTYDQDTRVLNLAQAKSEAQIRQFMRQYNQYLPEEYVPDWNLVFEPHNPDVVDLSRRAVNIYQPSALATSYKAMHQPSIPPTIHKVIWHVLGEDQATYDHFINWLAVALQTLSRTGTAWILQGTQGTGKGVLFHYILSPLFGEENVVSKRMEELESEFTGFMENKFVVFIDEIEAGRSLYHNKITAKLKNLIVEPTISIRKMYHAPYMGTNFSNMVFASNRPEPVEVSPDDRRFNVGYYQRNKLSISSVEIDSLGTEAEQFYAFLRQFKADANLARTPLISQARDDLINVGRSAVDTVSDALNSGNLQFLWEHLPATIPTGLSPNVIAYNNFRELVVDLVTTQRTALSREDLFTIYEWCIGSMPRSPNKLTSLLKHHGIDMGTVRISGRSVRGINVNWIIDPAWHQQATLEIKNGVI